MADALLKVEDLTITFPGGKGALPWQRQPDVRAVQGVSLEIVPGETLGLVGESGIRQNHHWFGPSCGSSNRPRVRFDLLISR